MDAVSFLLFCKQSHWNIGVVGDIFTGRHIPSVIIFYYLNTILECIRFFYDANFITIIIEHNCFAFFLTAHKEHSRQNLRRMQRLFIVICYLAGNLAQDSNSRDMYSNSTVSLVSLMALS